MDVVAIIKMVFIILECYYILNVFLSEFDNKLLLWQLSVITLLGKHKGKN